MTKDQLAIKLFCVLCRAPHRGFKEGDFPEKCPECKRKTRWTETIETDDPYLWHSKEAKKQVANKAIKETKEIDEEKKHILLEEYSVWEEDDKGKRKLILPNLGELIFNELGYHFLTTKDNETIYAYNGGYYESNGEQIIKDVTQQLLEKHSKEHSKNEVVGYVRDKNYQDRKIFDAPLNLINLKNGIYDINTGKLLKHSPDYHFLNELPVRYDPKAECPEIRQFLKEVVYLDDTPVIEEFFGYCLYRKNHIHKACMFLGGGANGKSTTLKVLGRLLGEDNTTDKELQKIIYDKFAVGSLHGKLANIAPDISDKAVERTGIFKAIVGGDRINASVKFKDDFDFYPYIKLIFSANRLPKSEDDSYAYARRWILISFPNTFEGKNCDLNILDVLTTPEELSGLFNLAIIGLKRLLANDGFSYGKTVEEVMEQMKTLSDPIYAYCTEFLKCEINKHIFKVDLREHYIKWSKINKLPITPSNILTQELANHLPEIRVGKAGVKGKQKPAYWNITWQEKEEKPQTTIDNPDTKVTGGET